MTFNSMSRGIKKSNTLDVKKPFFTIYLIIGTFYQKNGVMIDRWTSLIGRCLWLVYNVTPDACNATYCEYAHAVAKEQRKY